MAKCRDYERHTDCPYFHKVTDPDEQVQVGTSMKKLDQHCFYCFKTERCKNMIPTASPASTMPGTPAAVIISSSKTACGAAPAGTAAKPDY